MRCLKFGSRYFVLVLGLALFGLADWPVRADEVDDARQRFVRAEIYETSLDAQLMMVRNQIKYLDTLDENDRRAGISPSALRAVQRIQQVGAKQRIYAAIHRTVEEKLAASAAASLEQRVAIVDAELYKARRRVQSENEPPGIGMSTIYMLMGTRSTLQIQAARDSGADVP